MYIPGSFKETQNKEMHEFIRENPLGLLISNGSNGLCASPLPFLVHAKSDSQYCLLGHMAKANSQWKDLENLTECLVSFQGCSNYVSPSWYATKADTHKVVPTWNYACVQVQGTPSIFHDPAWLLDQITALTESQENKRSAPWQVKDAPTEFIQSQLQAIVGIEIVIEHIEGKWKMSQNREPKDVLGVVAGMSDPSDPHYNTAVSTLIKNRN